MLPTGVQHDDLGVPEPHPKALCMLSLDHAIPLAVELGNQISSCYISSRQECSPWIIPGVTELVVPAPLQQRCCLLCIVCKPVFSVLRTQRGKAVPTCILQKHINHPRNKDNAGGRVRYLCEHSPTMRIPSKQRSRWAARPLRALSIGFGQQTCKAVARTCSTFTLQLKWVTQ